MRNRELVLPTKGRAPGFEIGLDGPVLKLSATGSWTVREAAAIAAELGTVTLPIAPARAFSGEIDVSAIDHLDTAGAWLLQRTADDWSRQGITTDFAGITDNFGLLIEEVRRRGSREVPSPPSGGAAQRLLADSGRAAVAMARDFYELTGFFGAATASALATIARPSRFRTVSFVHHLEHSGLRALPIVVLICLLIGAVVMQQGVVQLRPYGAETFALDMLGILSLREVGVLLTVIMVAGRSGSAYTAEIGAMKMREEVDAMRTLGLDPFETLVLPRLVALVVALPVLTFFGDLACLAGGGLYAWLYLDMEPRFFADRLREAVDIRHFTVGMIKTPFAALIIGLVGSLEGLRVRGSAESLGRHVTSAVVKAIFLVIILDAFFAMFLAGLGL